MHDLDASIQKLNFTVDLKSLEEFYKVLSTEHEHLRWKWEEHAGDLNTDVYNTNINKITGWLLQSDMEDPSIRPSMLKSKHARVPWYNTELMFGLAARMYEKIPFAYRWTFFILPPGGHVVKHIDENEYVIHIPLFWHKDAVFIMGDEVRKEFTFLPTGEAYCVDVEVHHETFNRSNENRVGMIFRIKRDRLQDLLAVTGHFE